MATSSGTGNHHDNLHWTPEEQAILEDLLIKHASISNILLRYAVISQALNDKIPRDVALRVRLMREMAASDPARVSSQFSARPNVPPSAPPMIPISPYAAIGGPTAELLEQNAQFLSQISANYSSGQIYENLELLLRTRDNLIRVIMNDEKDSSEVMKKMPSPPWNMNEELANKILPLPRHQPQ